MIKVGGFKRTASDLNTLSFKADNINTTVISINADAEYIIPEVTPISNQGSSGSCSANSSVDAVEILIGLQNPNKVVQLSRLFAYWNARTYIKETHLDEGCYIHDLLDSFKNIGICSEETWKFDLDKIFLQPDVIAYKEANDNQIDAFYQIKSTGKERADDVEAAVRINHPVVFGTLVNKEFSSYFYGTDARVFEKPDDGGAHAMVIVGVRNSGGKRKFLVRNSWGTNFGFNGYVWISEDYLTWDMTSDLFVASKTPNLMF